MSQVEPRDNGLRCGSIECFQHRGAVKYLLGHALAKVFCAVVLHLLDSLKVIQLPVSDNGACDAVHLLIVRREIGNRIEYRAFHAVFHCGSRRRRALRNCMRRPRHRLPRVHRANDVPSDRRTFSSLFRVIIILWDGSICSSSRVVYCSSPILSLFPGTVLD